MPARFLILAFLLVFSVRAVVVDRIAIVVGNRVIKISDIDREVRVTDFLNGDRLDLGAPARKKAAERLIDQWLIRREIDLGGYAVAGKDEVQRMLQQIKRRHKTDAAFRTALSTYGISEEQLTRQLTWQLTVLRFIDQRFRPGVLVTEEEIERFYKTHNAGAARPVSLEAARPRIEDQLIGERINEQFYAWLAEARKEAKPEWVEGAL